MKLETIRILLSYFSFFSSFVWQVFIMVLSKIGQLVSREPRDLLMHWIQAIMSGDKL